MSRVVAYARVSTDKQDSDNQEFELRNYMDDQGYQGEVVKEVVSGIKKLRDRKLGGLIEELQGGDTLIVSEISRLSRDMLTVASTIQTCLNKGIVLIAVKEGWTLGNDVSSKFTAVAFGMAAEMERNFISQRTKEALARKKAEGMVLGRPVGLSKPGFRKLNGKDDELVALLKARVSNAAIARYFNVNVQTVRAYVRDRGLVNKALGLDDNQGSQTGV